MLKVSSTRDYDYIIAGMGCAGLSLAIQLKRSNIPFNKILIIDKDVKHNNDRTWCFWTKQKENWFDDIVYKSWKSFEFRSEHTKKIINLSPYQYMLIRGIDFYDFCLNELKTDARFEFETEEIILIETNSSYASLKTNQNKFSAKYIFNSAIRTHVTKPNHINYVQHFKGYVIETPDEVFNDSCPVFMDFSVDQKNDCRFVYTIPYSKKRALVEYTGFSEKSISEKEYDEELHMYISKTLNIIEYTIIETEKGEIPMAESEFVNPFGSRVINLGTAGGNSKASTGYTFYFIQNNVERIIKQLKSNQPLVPFKTEPRFKYYDKVLLDVIHKKTSQPSEIFEQLFTKNKPADLLAFLNEESTLVQDFAIMNSVPKLQFVVSAIKKMIK